MGVIKGFYVDKTGQVHTYWTNEVIKDPVVPKPRKDWKTRRKNQIRCRIVRGSVLLAAVMANAFLLTLAGSDPNWALGIGGALVSIGWVAVVVGANGGNL